VEPKAGDDTAEHAIARALGEEIRRSREAQGLNRAQLAERMPTDISAQALANYEYGIRQFSVVRLVEICDALDVPATDLLGLALQRAEIHPYTGHIQVDLRAVADDKHKELRPLRKWARNRLAQDLEGTGVARLSQAVIGELAIFMGMDRSEFVQQLLRFTPDFTPLWAAARIHATT
jgi:transcriptional regulator with XRE-family HTH domain